MKKMKWLMSMGGVGVICLMFLIKMMNQPAQAKAYEFWGSAQVINCDKSVMIGLSDAMDLSVNGKVVTVKSVQTSNFQVHFGTEVTCNGFRMTTCPGTDCQIRN